jgi:aspartyl-tRNA(Asn)/glutamyl-tRNA(Gln) amidotransferase subunit A
VSDRLTISGAAEALRARATTSAELVECAVAIGDATDGAVGSFLSRFTDKALAAARQADEVLADGGEVRTLHGIPLGVKDIITTSEAPSTAQSLVLDPAWSDGDAVVVSRLRAAGGIVLAKTTTMEFAMGMPDGTKPFPIPRNPWNLERWAGGSSSGSASAVATGAVLGALGTDTGGSIRMPAAFCGVTGLMPSYGRVPKTGCVPLGYSLDRIGPIARSAEDCAMLLSVLAGHDARDMCSIDEPVPDYLAGLTGELTDVRIGVDRLLRSAGDAEDPALLDVFEAALAELRALGAETVELELPFYDEIAAANLVILCSEALAYHLPDLQTRWSDYFAGTRAMVGRAVFYSGADYVQAQRARRVGQKAVSQTYRDVDLIVTPTASAGAPTFAALDALLDEATSGGTSTIHTSYWDAIGNPVISVPMGFTGDGMPLGMQIAGRPFDEVLVLRAADAYQRRTEWHLSVPPAQMVGDHLAR